MTPPPCRPSDAVALFFGIQVQDEEAQRLDAGVMRLNARVAEGLLAEAPMQPGFQPAGDETAGDA